MFRMEGTMDKKRYLHISIISALILLLACIFFTSDGQYVQAQESKLACVLLSSYTKTLDIGDEFYLMAWTSNGKKPSWKSSNSRVASVNTYGLVTAKKAGSVKITAKISGAEMSCRVTVNKTTVTLNKTSLSLERNATERLTASVSTGAQVVWKSSKKSVAVVGEDGTVIGVKPGEAMITASADGTKATCLITVKQPTVTLNKTSANLYRGDVLKLTANVSSGITPTWRSSKKSVAVVDENGTVTAIKHGTAIITAKVDNISKICQITVESPEITLNYSDLDLKVGETVRLTAAVSSGNPVEWRAGKTSVADVSADGTITAYKKGTCYIYASEDGAKERCVVRVTE